MFLDFKALQGPSDNVLAHFAVVDNGFQTDKTRLPVEAIGQPVQIQIHNLFVGCLKLGEYIKNICIHAEVVGSDLGPV